MEIKAYKKFKKLYLKLPIEIQRKTDKQIQLLVKDFEHPSLQCKKIQGKENIWEARVDQKYRMTFEIINKTVFLRVIANHDDALRNP